MEKNFDLIVAGEINPDIILADPNLDPHFGQTEILVEKAAIKIGSSSAIFACGAARLGLKTAFIGVVGEDIFGEFMLNAMQEQGIDITRVIHNPNQQTGFSVILNRGADRAIITYMGTINTLQAEQISDDFLQQGRHLHIASYFLQKALQPGLPSLFQRAHQFGLTTSLDVNWDPSEKWQGVSDILPEVDIFLPNEAEALSITGTHSIEEALKKLSKIVPYVVIKTGAKGGVAKHGENTAKSAALPVEVVDTIGAGDSFNAGFLYGFLHNWDLQKSLQLGVICGSLNTRGQGGTDSQPTLEQAMEYIPQS